MTDLIPSLTDRLITKIMASQPLSDDSIKELALQGIIDYFASSLQARHHSECNKLLHWLTQEGGTPQAWLVGQSQYATSRQAAVFNGFQAHLLDYDDVHADVRGHPSAVILSALFASIDKDEISSHRFLSAYIVGIEVMAHLGKAIGHHHYQKGWHNTATLGGIAGAAAICYLHHYPFIKDVLAIAATQASGLRLLFGTSIKPLHAGIAAQTAIQACQWAKIGLTADCDFLDDKKGFLAVYGEGNQALNLNNWGEPWRIADPGLWFKHYSYCSAAAYVADATYSLLKQYHFNIADITAIQIIFPQQSDDALIYRQVSIHEQGRFSAEYIVAAILLKRPLTFETFNSQAVDQQLNDLMAKITRHYDTHATSRYAEVIIKLYNNQQVSQRINFPKGSPGNPYSQIDLKTKFFDAIGDKNSALTCYDLLRKFGNNKISVNILIEQINKLLSFN